MKSRTLCYGPSRNGRTRFEVILSIVPLTVVMLASGTALSQEPTPISPRQPGRPASGARPLAPAAGVVERKLPSVEIRPDAIQVHRRAPLAFKPFPVADPATGKSIPPETILTLPDGKQVKAGEYYAELNKIEQGLTTVGYSLRTMPDKLRLQETIVNHTVLREQASALRNRMPVRPRVAASSLTPRFHSTPTVGDGQRVLMATELTPETVDGVLARNRDASVEVVGKELRVVRRTERILPPSPVLPPPPEPKTLHREQPWNWSVGDTSTFEAHLNGMYVMDGKAYAVAKPINEQLEKSDTEFKISAEGRAGGAILGDTFDLVVATASFYAPAKTTKPLNAKLNISILGATVYNFNEDFNKEWKKSDTLSHGLSVGVPFGIPLGFVWLGGEIGAKGDAGLRYEIFMNRAGVGGDVHPFVHSSAYGEGGVSVVVGGAGVGAEMTLLNAELGLWGQARFTWWLRIFVINEIYCDYDLDMLSGRIYGYVYVYVPRFGVPPWKKKQWEHNFWDWDGFKVTGVLVDDRQYITF